MAGVDIDWLGKGKAQARDRADNNQDPEQMIEDAAIAAIRMARLGAQAIDEVLVPFDASSTLPRWSEHSRRAFLLYFGMHTSPFVTRPGVAGPGHVNIVAHKLRTLVRRLKGGIRVKVRGETGAKASLCKDGRTAFQATGPLANRTFNLCPRWFELKSSTARATIMLHELCHAIGGVGFTTDLKNQFGKVVRGSDMTRRLAEDRPRKARRNPENYEEFFNYLIRVPSTIGRRGWKGVNANLDAAIVHPNGKAYFFKGNRYQRYDFDLRRMDREGVIGRDGWTGIKAPVDAAILHPNGKAYFFSGRNYQRYNFSTRKKDGGGVIGRDGWRGLKPNIDAALINPKDGRGHFFSTIYYRRFDFDSNRKDRTDVIGDVGWRGLAGRFDAALVHPRNNKAYFFVGDSYFRYDFSSKSKDKVDNVRTLS